MSYFICRPENVTPGHPRSTTVAPPRRPRVVCGVFTWRTVELGVNTRARLVTQPGTRRCRGYFRVGSITPGPHPSHL